MASAFVTSVSGSLSILAPASGLLDTTNITSSVSTTEELSYSRANFALQAASSDGAVDGESRTKAMGMMPVSPTAIVDPSEVWRNSA